MPMTTQDQAYDDVRLRSVEGADLDVFFEYQRDPVALRMAAATAETREPFLVYWAEIRADRAVLAQTVMVNGEVAGNLMCWERWGLRQVGFWIGRRYWGRGVATTALALFLCDMTARPVHAYVALHNAGSTRVLEKCGFRRVTDPRYGVDAGSSAESALAEYVLEP
jgi:RimJ/RimL family protein N-acetyltransferase